jgi:hypothetical protein
MLTAVCFSYDPIVLAYSIIVMRTLIEGMIDGLI